MANPSIMYLDGGVVPKGDKRRFVLPSCLRAPLRASSDDANEMLVAPHSRYPCLVAFGRSRAAQLMDDLRKAEERALENGLSFDDVEESSEALTLTVINFDSAGRFVMPEDLLNMIGAGSQLFIMGTGPSIQIWAPEILLQQEGLTKLKRTCSAKLSLGSGEAA